MNASGLIYAALAVGLVGAQMLGAARPPAALPAMAPNPAAAPALPVTLWGALTVDDDPAPAGTLLRALIGGRVVASTATGTGSAAAGGPGAYTLQIPGDDPDTPAMEGGRDGDVIAFAVDGLTVKTTGVWRTGDVAMLALRALTSTSTPVPTDTPTVTPPPPRGRVLLPVVRR